MNDTHTATAASTLPERTAALYALWRERQREHIAALQKLLDVEEGVPIFWDSLQVIADAYKDFPDDHPEDMNREAVGFRYSVQTVALTCILSALSRGSGWGDLRDYFKVVPVGDLPPLASLIGE